MHFLPSLQDCDVKLPNFTSVLWRTRTHDNYFLFLCVNLDTFLYNSTPEKFANIIDKLKELEWERWSLKQREFARLFTVPYFFVRSFRYTAPYRHGYLDFPMYREGGRRGLNRPRALGSFDSHARWVARNTKLSISMILRKNRGLWTVEEFAFWVTFSLPLPTSLLKLPIVS